MFNKLALLIVVLFCASTFSFSQCLSDDFSTDYGNWTGGFGTYRNTTAGLTNQGIGFNSIGDNIITSNFLTNPETLTFWLARTSSTANRTLSIEYSTNNIGPWTSARDILVSEVTTTHQEFSVNLNLIGDYYLRIAITQRSGGSYYLDDVTATCGGCVPAHTLSSFAPSTGPELTEVTINGTGFTAGTSVSFNGIASTNVNFVSATKLIAEVPTGTTTGRVTITEASCDVRTTTDFTVIAGNCSSGGISVSFTDLLISGVYDDQTDSCHYIELLNPTASDIDLSTYTLGVDNNFTLGSAAPTSGFNKSMVLTGTVAAGDTVMIRLSSSGACSSCSTIIPDLSFTGGGLNDEDRIVLVNGTTAQDVWQNHTTPGIGFNVGYVFTRENIANAPSTTFNLLDWSFDGNEDCFGFSIAITPSPNVTMQPIDIDNCNTATASLTVSAGNGGAMTYQWKYNDGTSTSWSDVTSAAFSPGIVTGQNANNLSITGFNLDGYQFYCEITEAGVCDIASNAFQVTMKNTVWNGSNWSNGIPDVTTLTELNGNYNTDTHGSFSACSLIINSGFRLTVENNNFVEIENDVTVDGELYVQTQGAFVQNSNTSSFNLNASATALVNKRTTPLNSIYDYTYWSSPIQNLTIQEGLAFAHPWRRYWFNAANFLDEFIEINNTNTFIPGSDGIDDDGNDWTPAYDADVMIPGVGYTAMHNPTGFVAGNQYTYTFEGAFNNGIINAPISYNGANGDEDWNLIGNPYASAIDANDFLNDNAAVIGGAIYLWSQNTPADANTSGNQGQNFSQGDYAIITNGSGNTAGGDMIIPNSYVPSGQSFFVQGLANGNAVFSNAHRMADGTSNSQFFRNSSSSPNRIWVNLTSDNGVFNQILVAYVNGATNGRDSMSFDARASIYNLNAAVIYTEIENDNDRFTIQGKTPESLSIDEVIPVGFETVITAPTLYTFSIAQFEGDFFENNTVYLKDNLLNITHDLSASDYTFTSEVGNFNSRFEIVFKTDSLSTEDYDVSENNMSIIELQNGDIQFSIASESLTIKAIKIVDPSGRTVYNFRGSENTEIFNLSNLSSSVYIAVIELSNGATITKKAIKK